MKKIFVVIFLMFLVSSLAFGQSEAVRRYHEMAERNEQERLDGIKERERMSRSGSSNTAGRERPNAFVQHIRDGNYDKAIELQTENIRLDPNNPDSYGIRANVYVLKGDYDSAIADYTEAIRLRPNSSLWYYHRGVAYEKKGDIAQAIADYETVKRLTK